MPVPWTVALVFYYSARPSFTGDKLKTETFRMIGLDKTAFPRRILPWPHLDLEKTVPLAIFRRSMVKDNGDVPNKNPN